MLIGKNESGKGREHLLVLLTGEPWLVGKVILVTLRKRGEAIQCVSIHRLWLHEDEPRLSFLQSKRTNFAKSVIARAKRIIEEGKES